MPRTRSRWRPTAADHGPIVPRAAVVGRFFGALEADGECLDIRYGQLTANQPRWHVRSHTRYDGIGGLVDVIRSVGGRVLGDMPELEVGWRPHRSLDVACRLARLW